MFLRGRGTVAPRKYDFEPRNVACNFPLFMLYNWPVTDVLKNPITTY